ncbi:MAG: DNA polymerase IV [Deltaproteobacteria bacterium]|nr:MAG: DNA polymerase IV [Deltaproteobacteria bacterium]
MGDAGEGHGSTGVERGLARERPGGHFAMRRVAPAGHVGGTVSDNTTRDARDSLGAVREGSGRGGEDAGWSRVVFHVDMDAFYASIEQRDRKELRGRAVVVGGSGRRAVVTTASYEARRYGVRSAMPMEEARRRCPMAIVVAPRMDHYVQVSRLLIAILEEFSPVVEPLGLDEAWLDMTGTGRVHGAPVEAAELLRATVRKRLGLTASVGVGSGRRLAKIASDMNKPDGVTVCLPGTERAFLAPLPVERLPGVGPRTCERLQRMGVFTVADVVALGPAALARVLGSAGPSLHRLALGHDDAPVCGGRVRKSLGAERTLPEDIVGVAAVRAVLLPLVDEVAAGLRAEGLRASGVRLKLRDSSFRTMTREQRLERSVDSSAGLWWGLDPLLERLGRLGALRLVGVTATGLRSSESDGQLELFGGSGDGSVVPDLKAASRLGEALDAVERRFGRGAVRRASVAAVSGGRSRPGGDS